jgi:acyl-coenzyme A thioesterase PaaI-like protein
MSFDELIRQARASGDVAAFNRAVPYMRFLGTELVAPPAGPLLRMPFQPKLIGNPSLPALHGGVTGALLESAAIAMVILEVDAPRLPKIVNISIDYLRPGRPVDTFAWGRITRLGRRIVNVQAAAWQGEDRDNPIATASSRFLIG